MYYNEEGTHAKGKAAAKFRAEAKAADKANAKNGQNIISHTSIAEQGRCAKGVREAADMYENFPADFFER